MKQVGICKSEIQAQGFLGNGMQIGVSVGRCTKSSGVQGASKAQSPGVQVTQACGSGVMTLHGVSSVQQFSLNFFQCVCHFYCCHPVFLSLIKSWQVKLKNSTF